jgi:hypothetical protein
VRQGVARSGEVVLGVVRLGMVRLDVLSSGEAWTGRVGYVWARSGSARLGLVGSG